MIAQGNLYDFGFVSSSDRSGIDGFASNAIGGARSVNELRSALISLLDWAAVRSGLARGIGRTHGGHGAVFMFHRLLPDPDRVLRQDICFSRDGLVALLRFCRDEGIDVVDIDEALRRLRDGHPRRFLVLTFDDGYRDNLHHLLPVMEDFGLPFTVFVSSGMIERSVDYWWGGLLELFRTRDEVEIAPMQRRFRHSRPRQRQRGLRAVTRWVEADVAGRAAELARTFRRYGISPEARLERDALSREDLRTLARHRLVTIGGHGASHRPLASLSPREAEAEITADRRFLQTLTDREVAHFAYPHGCAASCGWREARLVETAGYRSAFTTRRGNLFPAHAARPFMLPRGAMNPRRPGVFHAEAQLAGVHRFVEAPGRGPIHPDTLSPGEGPR